MSKSYIQKISEIKAIEGADRLEAVKILGFWCVVGKGLYKVGDEVVYIETDSVISEMLESIVFANSKIKPQNRRIRAIRIRGFLSEGLVIDPVEFSLLGKSIGESCDDELGITKYEPPEQNSPRPNMAPKRNKSRGEFLTSIPRYVDTTRIEKVPNVFRDDDLVHVTAKLHGTSVRFGHSDLSSTKWYWNLYLKAKSFLGFKTSLFVAGSRNVDFPSNSLYEKCGKDLALESKLGKNEVLFGEIVGPGIQGNGYDYGFAPGSFGFFAYAVSIDNKFLDYYDFMRFCNDRGIQRVPLVFSGKWAEVKDYLLTLSQQRTQIERFIPCREGLVIGLMYDKGDRGLGQRTIVKYINPEYLLNKENTDNH